MTSPFPPKAVGGVCGQLRSSSVCLWSVGEGGGELKTEPAQQMLLGVRTWLQSSGISEGWRGAVSQGAWCCSGGPFAGPLGTAQLVT